MKKALEPVPLLVAAIIGVVLGFVLNGLINPNSSSTSQTNNLLIGGLTGIGVQIGVRLTGVS
jgi:hypothetical protein